MRINRLMKRALICMMAAAMTAATVLPVFAEGEVQAAGTLRGWQTVSGNKYYYDETGKMLTGFQNVDGKTYYFSNSGVMKTGWLKMSDGRKYYFGTNGVMQTGFKKIKGSRYYFIPSGEQLGIMANIGLYKNYIISYTGKCYKIPNKKTGNMTADANRVAKLVAQCCGKKKKMTDLQRVSRAAYYVKLFSSRCRYTMSGPYYNKPYGVFIAKQYSCAGSTRALGLVLDYLGYKWTHVNENQYSHQWCKLKMDGKMGYADGQVGWAGYGNHPAA